jgi:hypothetical protein
VTKVIFRIDLGLQCACLVNQALIVLGKEIGLADLAHQGPIVVTLDHLIAPFVLLEDSIIRKECLL